MIRISLPPDLLSYSEIIDKCCKRNTAYKQNVLNNKSYLIQSSDKYVEKAKINKLYEFNNMLPINPDDLICGQLTNDNMIKLYEYCLRKVRCGDVYEKIINLAKAPDIQCPFCGGINTPSQIDHFLPKSRYGIFSIYPYNLLPICGDCNTKYKKEFFPTTKKEQLVHPYLDSDCFFNEQWLYAEYIDDGTGLGAVKYFINPPAEWDEDKKSKVCFHFDTFKLSERYPEKAAGVLSDILTQMKSNKLKGISMDDFEECNIDSIINSVGQPNHWKRVLLQEIKDKISEIWDNIDQL